MSDDGGCMIFVDGRRLFVIALTFRRFIPAISKVRQEIVVAWSYAMEEIIKFLEKINIYDAYKKRKIKPNENITVEVNIKRCKVYVVCNNWRKYGNDRGGHYRN